MTDERRPFDGRPLTLPAPSRRRPLEGHGPYCSTNPEIGCVCGEADRQSDEDERRNAPDARTEQP